jgi:cytochrome c
MVHPGGSREMPRGWRTPAKPAGAGVNAANLDRWLTNPQTLVPGARMFYAIPDAQVRADIIAYLASQK